MSSYVFLFQGSLETKEYILTEVAKGLGLQADRFCILAALLGNYLLTERDLADFYHKLGMTQDHGKVLLYLIQDLTFMNR
jgi:hypothetical protein